MMLAPLLIGLIYIPIVQAQAQRDFNSTLEQEPPVVGSPDTVHLKCWFDKTGRQYQSVIWTRGDNLDQIYSQTSNDNKDTSRGYENIVVEDESQVTLSRDDSGDWSLARLTMQVNRCLADKYQCLITDTITTEQSESEITLTFQAPTVTIAFDGETFTGNDTSNIVHRDLHNSPEFFLSGRYRDAMVYDDSPVFTSDLANVTITQGTTANYDSETSNCNYGGDTSGGTISFPSFGEYTVKYAVNIGGSYHEASVAVCMNDPTVTITFDGETFTGTDASSIVHRDLQSSSEFPLYGRYRAVSAYDDSPVFASDLATVTTTQGTTVRYEADASNCNYGGDTSGVNVSFPSFGEYTVKYGVNIGGTSHEASVAVCMTDPEVNITINNQTFSGVDSKNTLRWDLMTSETYQLSGMYRHVRAYASRGEFISIPNTATFIQGTEVNYCGGVIDCNYGGHTRDGSITFSTPGDYTVSYKVEVGGTEYEASVSFSVTVHDSPVITPTTTQSVVDPCASNPCEDGEMCILQIANKKLDYKCTTGSAGDSDSHNSPLVSGVWNWWSTFLFVTLIIILALFIICVLIMRVHIVEKYWTMLIGRIRGKESALSESNSTDPQPTNDPAYEL